MINDVMVFTPVYRLEPETYEAIFNLEWDGPLTFVFQDDNPHHVPGNERKTGVENHLHQYRRGRETFLAGRYDAMLCIESDIIPPPDALKKLAALDADLAYGVYMFRVSPIVNLFEAYNRPSRNHGESFSIRHLWPPPRQIMECSGGGLGCVLIKRHVLEKHDFRLSQPTSLVHCDSPFTGDCWQAGYDMRADTTVICGHKDEHGHIKWPPGVAHHAIP